MSRCRQEMIDAGEKLIPRSCPLCVLGPCRKIEKNPQKVLAELEEAKNSAEKTAKAFDVLSASLERLSAAAEKIADLQHGGISIKVVGEVVSIDVKPPRRGGLL